MGEIRFYSAVPLHPRLCPFGDWTEFNEFNPFKSRPPPLRRAHLRPIGGARSKRPARGGACAEQLRCFFVRMRGAASPPCPWALCACAERVDRGGRLRGVWAGPAEASGVVFPSPLFLCRTIRAPSPPRCRGL